MAKCLKIARPPATGPNTISAAPAQSETATGICGLAESGKASKSRSVQKKPGITPTAKTMKLKTSACSQLVAALPSQAMAPATPSHGSNGKANGTQSPGSAHHGVPAISGSTMSISAAKSIPLDAASHVNGDLFSLPTADHLSAAGEDAIRLVLPAAQCSYGQHPRWLFGFFEEGFNLGDTSGNDRDKALVNTVVLAILGDQTVVSQ